MSSALAQYDKLVKRAQLLGALIEPRSGNWFGIDELKNIKNPPRSMGFLEHGKTKIDVAMLDGAELARLESMRQKVTTAMYAQADAIAELNKSTLSLELPTFTSRRSWVCEVTDGPWLIQWVTKLPQGKEGRFAANG